MDLKNKKILIVGAGLAGSTIARVLAEESISVTILEQRSHIAGNIYDYTNHINENIHKYGPHIVHCNKDSLGLKFLCRFTEWIPYEHKVRALLSDGRTTPIPINQTTIEDVYHKKFKNSEEVRLFLESIRNKKLIPKNTDELFESMVGNELADIFFRPYTKKMWGINPKNLTIGIGSRLSVKDNKDPRYFNDNFQALPKGGYTNMVKKMLDHPKINVLLNCNFTKGMEKHYDHSFLCIPIDKFFNYKFGKLPYRSIKFETEIKPNYNQDAPVVNFTDNSLFTRKTQWNLFPNNQLLNYELNSVTYEIPCSMDENPNEYYYPVQTKTSQKTYLKYKKYAKNFQNITFCGRTGLFKYIDMIPAVLLHLTIANKFLKKIKNYG